MSEPFFVAQTNECRTAAERRDWIDDQLAAASEAGGKHARATLGTDGHPNLLLLEVWDRVPKAQGEPRFNLAEIEPSD